MIAVEKELGKVFEDIQSGGRKMGERIEDTIERLKEGGCNGIYYYRYYSLP